MLYCVYRRCLWKRNLMRGRLAPLPPEPTCVPALNGFGYIYKPEKPKANATDKEKQEYKDDLRRWKIALDKSTWGFERREYKRTQKQLLNSKHGQVRRAREKNAFVEVVDPLVVFERDNWICQLCGYPVSKLRGRETIDVASLDHIIPLAKGGKHSYANTQLAHFTCNSRKGARV